LIAWRDELPDGLAHYSADGAFPTLDELCRTFGVSILTAAARFSLLHPAVSTVFVGMRPEAEVRSDVRFFSEPVPDGFWSAIREEFDP
jgi:D-threo-aldose 1-dehydrogenase